MMIHHGPINSSWESLRDPFFLWEDPLGLVINANVAGNFEGFLLE